MLSLDLESRTLQDARGFFTHIRPAVEPGPHAVRESEQKMRLNVFKAKIHRATVTDADVDYEGSVTIDSVLMNAAGILPFEAVHIWNVTTGTRLVTYALEGAPHSGVICVNGAAAHLNRPGEIVILATFADMSPEEARQHTPTLVFVDKQNRMSSRKGLELPLAVASPAAGRPDLAPGP